MRKIDERIKGKFEFLAFRGGRGRNKMRFSFGILERVEN
jgi:hypothetical protein